MIKLQVGVCMYVCVYVHVCMYVDNPQQTQKAIQSVSTPGLVSIFNPTPK